MGPGRISINMNFGARINLKLIYFALVCLLFTAALCAAQSAPKPETSNANQSAQPPATGTGQATEQTPPPAKPSAGQPAQPADQTQSQGQSQGKDSQSSKDAKKDESAASATSKDRLFFALPNFLTLENAGQVPPMTTGQKFKVVAQGSFDPIQIVWYAALSGICQAENCEPGFGQGWEAYGERYGAYAADGTIENFFVGAILPSVLRQDPRYFQSGRGSFFDRAGYSVSRIVVTRGDSGHNQFNFSEVFGSAISSAISTYSYHPRADRTLTNTASVWGSQVGYDTITLVVKEFWPDIRRKMKKQPH
jgi:hypothetical protein